MRSTTPFPSSLAPPLRHGLAGSGFLLALSCASWSGPVSTSHGPTPQSGTPREHANVENGLALQGYDPVAYFSAGGGEPVKGEKELTVDLRGVSYRFANEENRQAFLEDPEHFEPSYGGWCAWAMVDGDKVEVDPESFLIQHDRLLVFYDGFFADTRKRWLEEGGGGLEPKADARWNEILGRTPEEHEDDPGPKLGLEGNDPTTYGQDGDPKPGKESIATRIAGVEYRFATVANRLAFLRDPEGVLAKVRSVRFRKAHLPPTITAPARRET